MGMAQGRSVSTNSANESALPMVLSKYFMVFTLLAATAFVQSTDAQSAPAPQPSDSQQSTQAQQPASKQQPTFRTQSNIVLAPALVKDKAGNVVFGLQAKDFIIEDDGVEQPVRMDEAEEPEPISLAVVVQTGRTAAAELKRMRGLSAM